jgi:hypothetical protein
MHFIRNIIISLSVLLIIVLLYACRKLDKEGPATATVSIVLSHSQSTSRMARVSTSFNAGTDTELIALVPDNTTFNQKYLSLENRYQFALTDLSTDTVSLTVPLDTGIKLYSYAYFDEKFTLSELENTATQAEQFGETSSFTISSSDTSKNVSLKYFGTESTLDTTLLAHYAFEGNLNDESSYNRDLTEDNVSNITYSAADNTSNKSGRAALFNGTNTYAYTDNITLSDNFTVAFWTIPFSSSMSPWDSALSSGDSTSSGIFQIDFNDNNTRFCAGICYISTTLDSNEWNHIVITKSDNSTDNKKIRLYKNGVLKTYTYPIITLWDKIKVGLNRTGGGYWNGYIDELKIYNRTFSTQEVRDLHDSY